MSYLVFGLLKINDPSQSDSAINSIATAASKLQLHAHINNQIKQTVVHEMLGDHNSACDSNISLLLTATCSEDTSDSLISPYSGSTDHILDSLNRIELFTEAVMRGDSFRSIDMFFTEGYETDFNQQTANTKPFYEVIQKQFRDSGDIDSVHIHIQPTEINQKK